MCRGILCHILTTVEHATPSGLVHHVSAAAHHVIPHPSISEPLQGWHTVSEMPRNSCPLSLQRACTVLSFHSPSPSPESTRQVDLGSIYHLQCLWLHRAQSCSTSQVEGWGRLLGSSIFLGYFQLTACALNDVSALTELFDTLPNLSFPIRTRFSDRRKGCFIETLDTKAVMDKGMEHVLHGPARRSARRRWVDTRCPWGWAGGGQKSLQKPCRARSPNPVFGKESWRQPTEG